MKTNPIDRRIAKRLKSVRKSLGLTQESVSTRIGLASYQILQSIEKGDRPAKASELARLCELYCKDTWYFLREDEPPDQSFDCAWRNSQDTGDQPLVKAEVFAVARNYQLLEEVTGENRLPALEPWPDEFDLTWKSVTEKAKELVGEWNLGARPAACLHEILEEKRHIKIVSCDLREAGSALTAEGEFGYIVALNATEVPWRKNFSLAHELFHLLSKNKHPLSEIHRDTMSVPSEKPRYERLADTFAASLLMPGKDVVIELKKRLSGNKIEWVDLVGIAMEFGVSTEAMLWRLKNLGKLEENQVKQLLASPKFRNIDKSSRTGKTKSNLGFSNRMVRLGLKALKIGKISKGKFCQIFMITRAKFDAFISSYGDIDFNEEDAGSVIDLVELKSLDGDNEGRAMA